MVCAGRVAEQSIHGHLRGGRSRVDGKILTITELQTFTLQLLLLIFWSSLSSSQSLSSTWKSEAILFCLGRGLACFLNSLAATPNRPAPSRLNQVDDLLGGDRWFGGWPWCHHLGLYLVLISSSSACPTRASAAIITSRSGGGRVERRGRKTRNKE